MRKAGKFSLAVAGVLLGTLVFSLPVLAEESINASLDKETCEIGESVSLTVEAQTDGDFTVPPQISVEYNPARLQFDNCSCEYGGGGGGLVTVNDTSATIDFTTLSGGAADISISGVFSDSGESVDTTVSVNVNGDDTAAGTDGFASEQTGVSEGTVSIGDGRMVQTVFANEFMPSLFHKETCDYQGQTVECGKFDMGDITVLYTTDESGNDGKFMTYNVATSEMTDFRMIQGIENRFIIVLSECEGEIPAGYQKAVLDWNGQTLTAYMNPDASNGTASVFGNLSANDFFLLYAISSEGNKGWYQYDQNEGTYQRFFSLTGGEAGSSVSSPDGEADNGGELFIDEYLPRKAQMIMLFVFAALTLILVVVVIILAVKCSDNYDYYGEDYYGDEEEDAEDEEEQENGEDVVSRNSVKSKNGVESAASYVSRKMAEEDETEEVAEELEEPVMSKREYKEAMREEKWRKKEEKKAAKLRAKGFEETTPMDWSSFNTEDSEDDEDRRRYGKSRPPKYMQDKYAHNEEEEELPEDAMQEEEEDTENVEEETVKSSVRGENLPPRKRTEREDEGEKRRTVGREEDARERQKRLFEQQQRIEEQQRIEKQNQLKEQEKEQEKFIERQHEDEDLDEDFQFEFLNF